MPNIKITEKDSSTPGSIEITSNAVYIPGLQGLLSADFESEDYISKINTTTPYYYEDVTKFKEAMGDLPYKFTGNVPYSQILSKSDLDLIKELYTEEVMENSKPKLDVSGQPIKTIKSEYDDVLKYLGLDEDATPGANFINEGDVDKSYVMAIELLSQGIPVYYHCVADIATVNEETEENGDYVEAINGVNEKIKNELIKQGTANPTGDQINNYVGRDKMIEEAKASTLSINIVNAIYEAFNNIFTYETSVLNDMGNYVLKFVTSGGYPTFNKTTLAASMCELAQKRTDLVSIIDYFDFYESISGGTDTLFDTLELWNGTATVSGDQSDAYTYGAMFTPYMIYTPTAVKLGSLKYPDIEQDSAKNDIKLPASFGYLMAFSNSVRNYPSYYAVAGVARGNIPHLFSKKTIISNTQANEYQPREGSTSLNAITNVQPYGVRVWGNRTLKNNTANKGLTASSFLNIRILANEVKRYLYAAARRYTFEQNSDVLWINFKSMIIPKLEEMIQNNGITGYKFIKQKSDLKAQLKAKLILECVEAVEDFDLEVVLVDAVLRLEEGA